VKQDTIIAFKDILDAKRDSIAQLPRAEQQRLQAMENYKMQMQIDPEFNTMLVDIFVDFDDIAEANDLMKGFSQVDGVMPGSKSSSEEKKEADFIGVKYSYKKGAFKRDAYIIDKAEHQKQVDNMKQTEAFMSETNYTLKYTFPKKIKSASIQDAMFSLDRKTIEIRRKFTAYFKNPDVLDVEVILEK